MPNIVLDEGAFRNASAKLNKTADEMLALSVDMERSLERLLEGFDTPAGRSFARLYRERIVKQTREQGEVLHEIAADLDRAKCTYSTVFDEYRRLITLK